MQDFLERIRCISSRTFFRSMNARQAKGLLAISRWLSAATPRETHTHTYRIPDASTNKGTGMSSTYVSLHDLIVFSTKHPKTIDCRRLRTKRNVIESDRFVQNSLICWNRQTLNTTRSS